MRARRATTIWALLAFVLGVALGPVLGWERETAIIDTNIAPIQDRQVRRLAADGWTVGHTDQAGSLRLVTFERPRIVGLVRSLGDSFNNAAGWLAWATNSGVYSRR
jgi:hypothetical protein